MQKTKHNTNPYTFVHDRYSAVEEYHKLKQQLALTPEELARFNRSNIDHVIGEDISTDEIIKEVKDFIIRENLNIAKLAEITSLSRLGLTNILNGKVKKLNSLTHYKLIKALREWNNGN
jgi:hypothetical protein